MKHVRDNHNSKILYLCDICEVFNSENQRSVGIHKCQCKPAVVDELPFKCEHCERQFTKFSGMRVHVSIQHKVEYNESLPEKTRFKVDDSERRIIAEIEIRRVILPKMKYRNKVSLRAFINLILLM